ncbi:ATP-binding protein [Fortiea contorta]|uniref:ATP-binding protein n=1 Tax=Fortiea contorta TaxID=1892405 RepID=UPI00034B810D|nr:ATP-binding protein [Fortiea contorta]
MTDPVKVTLPEDIFAGGGEMGRVMRSLDWSQTLLGDVSAWPQSLKTTVSIILNSRYPMFVWWGRDLAAVYNDAYRPILGATKHPQFLGNSARDMWAEIWHTLGPLTDIVLNTGEPTWSEDLQLLMDRNGYIEETYFTFSYSPVRDESNGVGGVFCACNETTEQVIGERRLRTLRELAANTGEAKTIAAACRITTDTLSKNPTDIPLVLLYLMSKDGNQAHLVGTVGIAAENIPSFQQIDLTQNLDPWQIAEVIRTEKSIIVENLNDLFSNNTAETLPQQAVILPIARPETQQQAGWLVLGISPRRRFDEHYHGFFELIASNVATAIANARAYEEARERAEALAELDRAKTVFFSNVSHEFRTPLTLMLSPLEETLSVPDDTPIGTQRQSLDMVHRNSRRLLKLVNTLLDFSRIEAGRIQAVYKPTDLGTFTAELASVFRSAIERAGMRLLVDCPSFPAPAYVDREMWEKIVLNLLSNAFKFTFAGEITVTLQSQSDRFELSVCDTGIGIPEEELPRLFERFYRVKGSQGRTFEGSGIGLSLVEELVKLHGGRVEVTSVLGSGSCFTVSIPQGASHLPPDRISTSRTLTPTVIDPVSYVEEAWQWLPTQQETRNTVPEAREPIQTRSEPVVSDAVPPRILLVEDNSDMREYVKRLLQSQRYAVETVTDGMAALTAIGQHQPDLILSDVMMPVMDGFELLRSLRRDLATREIPIILLSARAGEESRVEGLQTGADDYLIKPFSARELLARVEVNLKLARWRREALQREQELRSLSETSQAAAEAARTNLANVLASIKDQFLVLDHQWRYIYVNDRVVEVTGIAREDLLGKSVWELFPDLIGHELYTQAHRAVTEQIPIQFEYFYQPWQRWFDNRIYPSDDKISMLVSEITDRKQAELALQETQERYRVFVEQSSEAIWCFEITTPVAINIPEAEQIQHFYQHCYLAECNQVMAQMYGVSSPSELIGRGLGDFLVESNPFNLAYLRAFIRSGYRLVDAESYETDQQGNPKVFLNNLVGIIEDDKLIRAWGTQRDITARKQAEAALWESENRFRQMAETVQDVFWIVDFDRQQALYVSPAYEQIWGRSCRSLYENFQDWINNVYPDDREMVRTAARQCLETGNLSIEYRVVRPDGAIRWVRDRGYNLEHEPGQTRRIAGIAEDITERKYIEASLRQSEERYRYLVESIPQLVWTADTNGTLTDVNQRWTNFTGLNLAQAQAEGWQVLVHPEDLPQLSQNWSGAQQAGIHYQAEGRMRRVDGVYRWHLHQAVPLKNPRGKVIKWFGTATDIEEQKQLEQQRERLLEQEQAARAQAETANRIKDEFLAVLSHELRSPLNPILGWSRLLLNGRLDSTKTTQAIQTIERNAKLQAQLIEDLLDVSRILLGKFRLETTAVNLASVIAAAQETVQLAAQAKSIQIQTIIEPNIGEVLGDAARLQQVVWNLLTNAVKFTDVMGEVEICLKRVNSHAQIQVSDTGKGIHPDFLPHVFEYFRQEDGATTRKFGGLGLGLAIVRHLVELHGGTVEATSPGEGKGATFTVSLPLLKLENTTENSEQSAPANLETSPLSGIDILVVDDEIDTRELIAFVLETAGGNVTTAASALEALEAIAQTPPDVLVSDIGMPNMDGYMLIEQVRAMQTPSDSQILAIALTAYAGEMNQQQALRAGFQNHLAKPIDPEQLVQAISNLWQINR